MNDNVEGFILKQTDYREQDVICTVLTKEFGKISLVVKSGRKMSSKNAGSILPYTKAFLSFDYKEGKTMFRLKTARPIKLYRKSHEDLEKSFAASILAEVADVFTLEGLENEYRAEIFDDLDIAFQSIEDEEDINTILSLYLVNMMDLFGITPDVEECVRCGNTQVHAISIKDGGFLCGTHAKELGIPFSTTEELKRFRLLVKAGLEHKDIVLSSTNATKDDLRILEEMIHQHSGLKIRSFSLYNRMIGIEK